jgi:DNA repair photolyase
MYYKYIKEKTFFAPGIKMWSNGIPLKADTWSSCNNWCKYCYANELRASTLGRTGIKQNLQVARILDIKALARIFETAYSENDERTPFMNWAIRNKYFIELGTMGEVFQEEDLEIGVSKNFFNLTSAYEMPIFINTKLNLICKNEEYMKLLVSHKAPIIICLTLTTVDDKLGKIYEPMAPLPSERLRTIKELSKYSHIKTIVYISPFMPGVTDLDPEKYTNSLLDAGILGAHLRDFYMQGKTFQNPFWQKYVKDNKDNLESFPGGYHASYESRKRFLQAVQKIATSRDKDFQVVGMKSKWFELNPYHGKMCYDNLPEKFKNGITDFTAIPIMRKIKENSDKPQLLFWNKIGHKNINLPDKIRTNEGGINNLMEGICNCNTSDINYEMKGEDWLAGGLWNGWKDSKPEGFFSGLDYIYPVTDSGKYIKENGDFIYAYLPREYNNLISDGSQTFLFGPPSGIKNATIDVKYTKDFLIPERKGGIEDKWLNNI